MPPDVKKFIVYGIGALVLYFILLSHGWIPEGRYATTSGTHRSFQTPSQQRGGVVGETGRTCTGPSGQVYKCDSYTGQCVCP